MLILVISHPVSYGASYSMYFVWEKQTAKPFFINRCVVMVCVWQPFWFWHLLIFHVSSSNASSFPQDNTTTFQTKGFPIDFSRIIALFVYFFWIQPGVPNDNPNDNETITKKSQNPYRPDTGPFAHWKPVFLGACCSSKMSKQAQDMAGLRCFLNELLQHETEGGQLIAEAQEAVPGKAQPGKKRWNDQTQQAITVPQRMQKHEALLPEGADARFGSIDLQSLIDRKKKTIEKRKQRLDRKRTLQNASESGSTSGTTDSSSDTSDSSDWKKRLRSTWKWEEVFDSLLFTIRIPWNMQGIRTWWPKTWKTIIHSSKIDDIQLDNKYWPWPI